PRPHGAPASGVCPTRRSGKSGWAYQRTRVGRRARGRLGRHVRRHHRRGGGGADRGQGGGVHSPPTPESAASRPRADPSSVPPGARPRDQQRTARARAARGIPGRRRRIQPRARHAPGQPGDPRGHQSTSGGEAVSTITGTPGATPKYTKKDLGPDGGGGWCRGWGDYAIVRGVQKTMPELGTPREDIVFISGIGCSSRFPYYINPYGFHPTPGRAPAIATGLKL